MTHTERFAPSPTGPLHLGHAYSALTAWDRARSKGGKFLLRIEDIDRERARPEWEAQIKDDLSWLGIHWSEPVRRQSEHLQVYRDALQSLWSREVLFICSCSRHDIRRASSAPQEGETRFGPDGLIYPGTCRRIRKRGGRLPHIAEVLRLDMECATQGMEDLSFMETGAGPLGETGTIVSPASTLISEAGDIVLARKNMATSYHLSVVVDDALQGVTHVTRGQDIFGATLLHVLLQRLLDLQTPVYHHHRLIRDDNCKRLAKRDDARAISKFREEGATPDDIRRMVGL